MQPPTIASAPRPLDLFPNLDLGDLRRTRRFHVVAEAVLANPGAPLPQIFPDRTDYNACLNLFDSPSVDHEKILASHRNSVLKHLETLTTPVLLLHDSSHVDFSGHTTLHDELGPIGNGGGRGWITHHVLAVDPTNRTTYGLICQILHVRAVVPPNESVPAKRERENRETRLWLKGVDGAGPTPDGCQRIDVADRGADVFEFLEGLSQRKRRFVIRSTHNRVLGHKCSDQEVPVKLHDQMRSLAATRNWTMEVPARTGEPARTIRLSATAQRVTLRPPNVRKGNHGREALEVTAVRVWEPNPAPDKDPVEWLLLTSEDVTADRLEEVVGWYACRMQIEEYHKVQKSGARIEGYQFQTAKRMAAWLALLSVISVALLNGRLIIRDPELAKRPAEEFVPVAWIKVVNRYMKRKRRQTSAGEFWTDVARMGGYQKNPVKEPPGWITLWRGWALLHQLIRYEMSSEK